MIPMELVSQIYSFTEMYFLIIGVALVFAGFSYQFFGDIWPYTLTEAIAIGGGAAISMYSLFKSLSAISFTPILDGDLLSIIPAALGLMIFLRLTKYRWVVRYCMTIMLGTSLGLTIGATVGTMVLAQIRSTVQVFSNESPFDAIIIFVGTVTFLVYFMYSTFWTKQLREGSLKPITSVGRFYLTVLIAYQMGKILMKEGQLGGVAITIVKRAIDNISVFLR